MRHQLPASVVIAQIVLAAFLAGCQRQQAAMLGVVPALPQDAAPATTRAADGAADPEADNEAEFARTKVLAERDLRITFRMMPAGVGELLAVQVRVMALRDMVPLVKLDNRLYRYSGLHVKVFGPDGQQLPGHGGTNDPPAALVADDVERLREHHSLNGEVSLMIKTKARGVHRVELLYAPLWIYGDTVRHELEFNVE